MMSLTDALIDALRSEMRSALSTHAVRMNGKIRRVDDKVEQLRADQAKYHTETTLGLAHLADELSTLKTMVEPLVAARARRARWRAAAWRIARSTPGMVTIAASAIGSAAGAIALF